MRQIFCAGGRARLARLLTLCLPLASAHAADAPTAPARDPKFITMATLPTTVAPSVLQESVLRDLLLRDALARLGLALRSHPYQTTMQTVEFLRGRQLDVSIMSDTTMVSAAPKAGATGVAMITVGYSSVIGRGVATPRELKGKRVGVVPKSVGAQALAQALAAANLKDSDIKPVAMSVEAMPEAMERGEIDAFAAWEPTPRQALSRHPEYAVVYRRANPNFLVFADGFMAEQPKAAELILAAFPRARRWLAADARHLVQAVGWALEARRAHDGKPAPISVEDGVAIVRSSMLDVVGLPLLPRGWVSAKGEGQRLFDSLQQSGALSASNTWDEVIAQTNRSLLQNILARPAAHGLDEFRYAP